MTLKGIKGLSIAGSPALLQSLAAPACAEADCCSAHRSRFSTAYRASTVRCANGWQALPDRRCRSSYRFRLQRAGPVQLPPGGGHSSAQHRGQRQAGARVRGVTSAARRFAVFRPSGQRNSHVASTWATDIRARPVSGKACARSSTRPTGGSAVGGAALRRCRRLAPPGTCSQKYSTISVVLARGWPNAIQPWPRSVKSSRCRRISLSPSAVT